ncbi:hypothetical protein Tsp_03399 [Trichinella spiralis]|uniref:hypothetical protein n=1 Tax=Trichinella spiralis TaxID=6334 RepID=UPI0001EFCDB2|nr:hypothetical protein Tsp_03399 [Trichinella spiralis]
MPCWLVMLVKLLISAYCNTHTALNINLAERLLEICKMDKCDQSNHSGINPFPLPARNDPNDLTLRHVERDTVIPKRVQERVKKEKCKEFYDIKMGLPESGAAMMKEIN